MSKLRILLADDHAILLEGLALLINAQPDMTVVAQATDGEEAVRLVHQTKPDVAVLDVSMPGVGGADAAAQIRAECPSVRVVALTRHAEQAYVHRLLEAGATGYVVKKTAADVLIKAIRMVAEGALYVDPALGEGVLQRTFATGRSSKTPHSSEPLTEREQQVLRAVAWGRTAKEIAAELHISIKTVEYYKTGASQKLALHTRADIVRYAVSQGWLSEN
jgi:DNA-binding NarL/FixJ family response regulator